MSFEMMGLNEAIEKINNLGNKLDKKKIVRSGAEIIQKEASKNAPVGDTAPHLKDNIVIIETEDAQGNPIAKIGPSKECFYGSFSEFGTTYMAAKPFLEPAYLAKKEEVVEETKKAIKDGI